MKMPPLLQAPSTLSARRSFLSWGASVNRLRTFGLAALAGSTLLFAGSLRANTELDVANGLASGSNLNLAGSYTAGTAPTATSDVTFNATNTYTSPYNFGAAITIGTLNDLSATALTISGGAGALTLAGGGDSVPGSAAGDLVFVGNGANLTYSQGIQLGLTGNFDVAGTGTANFTANIGDGSSGNATTPGNNSFGLVKTGTGNLLLSTNNTYTGGTTVNAGTLTLNFGGPSYGNLRGTITVNAGGTLAIAKGDALGYSDPATNGNDVTLITINGGTVNNLVNANQGYVASLNMTGGTFSSTGGGAFNINPPESNAPTITSNASATASLISAPVVIRGGNLPINVAAGAAGTTTGSDLRITGAISGTALTKNGAGILALTAANTYTGTTTVTAGSLFVSNTGSIGAGAVTVTGTGTAFGGAGTIGGAVTVGNGSILTAGNRTLATPTPGNLTTGTLTLATGSTFNAILASNTNFSTLTAAGTTALGGAAFSISLTPGATFMNSTILQLISSNVSGAFTNPTYMTGGYQFTADYTTDPGFFDVDVAAVPEPTTWACGIFMTGLAVAFHRRSRHARLG